MATLKLFFLLIFLSLYNPSENKTFENVTVLLSTQLGKLFINGKPPIFSAFISSSDNLSKYINLQPYEVVTIRHQNIPILTNNSLSNLPNIVHLSLSKNGIRKIEPGVLKNVPKLDGLSLEGNVIEEIQEGVFTGLTIKHLYLDDNKIKKIENGAFNNMTMTLISLNNNQISRWNNEWFVGTPVGSIYMANNLLEELPAEAFNYALQFKKINIPLTAWNVVLSKNKIRKIHREAFKHVNGFSFLSLADNYIEELPENLFDSVKNIQTLDITNNKLISVNRLFDDINIHQLILINNTLSCFPTTVFDISRINFIFVDGNPFTCRCVQTWKNFQIENDVWVLYNMKNLENNCVEK